MLVVSVSGELPISKEVDEVLRTAKTSLYIHRNKDAAPPTQQTNNFVVVEASTANPPMRPYSAPPRHMAR